ncbi:MAG: protein kinase [Clostridia bacterium]|nr:protein kinase [Clostridia bacterium]
MADDKYTDNIISKLRSLEKGRKLDLLRDYSAEELIGTGDHGSVYKIADSEGIPFTLKVIETTAARAEDCAAEIGLLDFLKNDSVVRLENWAYAKENKKRGYLLLIFEAAEDQKTAPNTKQVVQIGVELAAAMEECHKTGLLHLDIKPSNILCFEDDIYRLSDFGMVRVGSFPNEFSAPEYSDGGDFDHRADIYSLALSLYAMLGGDAKNAPDLKSIDGCPDGLLAVLRRACSQNPDDRYRFMREFGKALSTCLDGESIEPEQKGPVLDDEYLNDAEHCFAESEDETSVIDKEAVGGLFEDKDKDEAEEQSEPSDDDSSDTESETNKDSADITDDESNDSDDVESEPEDDNDDIEAFDDEEDDDDDDDTITIGSDEETEEDELDIETYDVIESRDAVRCTKGRAVMDIIIIVLIALALLALPALLTLL